MPSAEELIDQLRVFWEERQVSVKCPICETSDFRVSVGAEVYRPGTIDVVTRRRSELSDPNQDAYALYCATCGYVLNFKQSVLDDHELQRRGQEQ